MSAWNALSIKLDTVSSLINSSQAKKGEDSWQSNMIKASFIMFQFLLLLCLSNEIFKSLVPRSANVVPVVSLKMNYYIV